MPFFPKEKKQQLMNRAETSPHVFKKETCVCWTVWCHFAWETETSVQMYKGTGGIHITLGEVHSFRGSLPMENMPL